jgi:hypothetical protein
MSREVGRKRGQQGNNSSNFLQSEAIISSYILFSFSASRCTGTLLEGPSTLIKKTRFLQQKENKFPSKNIYVTFFVKK